jgi:hypothetical protein
MMRLFCLLGLFFAVSALSAQEALFLRDNIAKANAGDYLVAVQNKNYTLLHIYNRNQDSLIIEEITVPAGRINLNAANWREWVIKGAPGSTAWILYTLNLQTARPLNYYSVTKGGWFQMPERENFLATLLNLRLERLSLKERKKVGVPIVPNSESRLVWNPKLIIDGQEVANAAFDAWRTRWPQDGSEIAGKIIEVYTPQDPRYPSYFPYWLQISGAVGNAKLRIIDSGSGLISPAPIVFDLSSS